MFLLTSNVEKMKIRHDVKGLIKSLQYSKDWRIRLSAANGLDELGWHPEQDEIAAYYWLAKEDWEKCIAIGAPALKPLISALKYDKKETRIMAVKLLAKLGNGQVVEPLIATLHDQDKDIRLEAIQALSTIGHERSIEPLIAILLDASTEDALRLASAKALGSNSALTDARINQVAFALLTSIKTKDAKARDNYAAPDYSIANYLSALGTRIVPVLDAVVRETLITFKHILDADKTGQIDLMKFSSMKPLGKVGVMAFDMEKVNIDGDLFFAVGEAIDLDLHETMYVRPQPKTIMLKTCLLALGKVGDKRAMESPILALQDVRFQVRELAVEAIGKCGDHYALASLETIQKNDKSKFVRDQAKTAIKEIKQREKATIEAETRNEMEQDLLQAAEYGGVDRVKALLDSGVSVDAVDREKSTALGNAAVGGYVKVMEVLLDRGANVNAQNKDGITPLMRAAGNGHMEAVKLLLARGADPHMVDREGLTALQFAEMLGRREIAQILREQMNL